MPEQANEVLEVVGLGIPFEQLPVGRKFRSQRRTITETDLINFITVTGFLEVLFTDMEFLKHESVIKGRVVPAALPYTLVEGMLAQATMQHIAVGFLGMEFGVDGPTFVGDTVHVEVEILECRASRTRPDRGVVRSMNRIINQNGEQVIWYTPKRMLKGSAPK